MSNKFDPTGWFSFLVNREFNVHESCATNMEMVVFTTELLKLTQGLSIEQVIVPLSYIAAQNNLNLKYLEDYKKAMHIMHKSIMLN